MEDISLHIMDIVENGVTAGARNIFIKIRESGEDDILDLTIRDDGKGMDEDLLRKVTDPFTTTKSCKKTGLGLPLLKEAAEAAGGTFSVDSVRGEGTVVKARFRLSHVDRKPLGNMEETLVCLMAAYRSVDITYDHEKDEHGCHINKASLEIEAGERSKELPEWISFLKEKIHQSFERLSSDAVR